MVLVVDDEVQIVNTVSAYLRESGFDVVAAYDGRQALERFAEIRPELVVLDLMLPRLDGWTVARRVRERGNVPLILLTARDGEAERVAGLELGADDYVVKPFSPRELVARVKAVLRRASGQAPCRRLRLGAIEVDLQACHAWRSEERLSLTPTEFNLLVTLMRYPDRVFTRLQLLEATQGSTSEAFVRTVDTHIKNLRRKLETDPKHPRYLCTVYGMGYCFRAPEIG